MKISSNHNPQVRPPKPPAKTEAQIAESEPEAGSKDRIALKIGLAVGAAACGAAAGLGSGEIGGFCGALAGGAFGLGAGRHMSESTEPASMTSIPALATAIAGLSLGGWAGAAGSSQWAAVALAAAGALGVGMTYFDGFEPYVPPEKEPEKPKNANWYRHKIEYDIRETRTGPALFAPRSEVKLLGELYSRKNCDSKSQQVFEKMMQADDLLQKDQSRDDLDERPGHIVLPKEKFESHDGEFSHGLIKTEGPNIRTYSRKEEDSEIEVTWDKAANSVSVNFSEAPDPRGWRVGKPLNNHGSFSFKYDPEQNRVEVPNVQSLKEAETTEERRTMANDTNTLLESVEAWERVIPKLDQSSYDLNPEPGDVVVSRIPKSEALLKELEGDQLFSGSNSYGLGIGWRDSGHMSVEKVGSNFRAVADNGDWLLKREKADSTNIFSNRTNSKVAKFQEVLVKPEGEEATIEHSKAWNHQEALEEALGPL